MDLLTAFAIGLAVFILFVLVTAYVLKSAASIKSMSPEHAGTRTRGTGKTGRTNTGTGRIDQGDADSEESEIVKERINERKNNKGNGKKREG